VAMARRPRRVGSSGVRRRVGPRDLAVQPRGTPSNRARRSAVSHHPAHRVQTTLVRRTTRGDGRGREPRRRSSGRDRARGQSPACAGTTTRCIPGRGVREPRPGHDGPANGPVRRRRPRCRHARSRGGTLGALSAVWPAGLPTRRPDGTAAPVGVSPWQGRAQYLPVCPGRAPGRRPQASAGPVATGSPSRRAPTAGTRDRWDTSRRDLLDSQWLDPVGSV